MEKKNNSLFSLTVYMRWPVIMSVILLLLNILLLIIDTTAGLIMLIFTVIFLLFSTALYLYSRKGLYSGLIDFAQRFDSAETRLLNEMDVPSAIIDRNGNIFWQNTAFRLCFPEGDRSPIQSLFPDAGSEVLAGIEEYSLIHSTYGDRRYQLELRPSVLGSDAGTGLLDENSRFFAEGDKEIIFVTATDETELVHYRREFEESRSCCGLIYLDNYEEALESIEEVRRSLLMALVDRRVSGYINSLNGIVKKLEKDKYFFMMKERDVAAMVEDKFSILEEVKKINIGNDSNITLSIGVGKSAEDYNDNYESSRAAIEFALGRGGDQAVLKDGDNVIFFGGKTEAKEKNARVKARVKAQALRELLNTRDKLIVMGHKNADVDSLGACLGYWRIATTLGKKAWIVIGKPTHSLEPLYNRFINNPDYPSDLFITGDEALEKLDASTIVAVVDVNRPVITEEPRLLKRASTITIIDHHRKTVDAIENAVLTYIEPYSSSACELVAEIIQYIGTEIKLTPLEADAMYGGITVDTQNFVNMTGVRTFEAAAFLKRCGANVTRVRKMFRDSYNDYRAKAEAIDRAEIYREHFALSTCDADLADSPTVIGAQTANSLLEIHGIKASIVLTPYQNAIYVSARSIDELNVQFMMEKIGGGGHMSVAGAQLKDISLEDAMEKIKKLIDTMIDEGDSE